MMYNQIYAILPFLLYLQQFWILNKKRSGHWTQNRKLRAIHSFTRLLYPILWLKRKWWHSYKSDCGCKTNDKADWNVNKNFGAKITPKSPKVKDVGTLHKSKWKEVGIELKIKSSGQSILLPDFFIPFSDWKEMLALLQIRLRIQNNWYSRLKCKTNLWR